MPYYCKKCAADLAHAPTNRCPKCARLFDPANPRTYNATDHPALYRPWYRFSRFPILWSLAAIVTFLTTVLVGNGIIPLGAYVYQDLVANFDNYKNHIPNVSLLGLWALLLILLAIFRAPGPFRTTLIITAPIIFILAAAAAVFINITLDQQAAAAHPDVITALPPIASYIIPGLAWPALCLWTLALAIGWAPVMRTLPCMLVVLTLGAYWYLQVFPPIVRPQSAHPMTFIASIPFFLSLAIPAVTWLWSLKPAPRTTQPSYMARTPIAKPK